MNKRGFSEPRIITQWHELVGEDIANLARPVSVRFGKGSFGATLTLLCTGASAPLIEMQKAQIMQKLNDVYGYGAIERVIVTQTATTGFSKGQASFSHKKPLNTEPPTKISDVVRHKAQAIAQDFQSPLLKKAIEDAAITFMSTSNKSPKETK